MVNPVPDTVFNQTHPVMTKNVGRIDRRFRFLIGHILLLTGLWMLNGLQGNLTGIIISLIALIPFYIAITGNCFVFRVLKLHTLSNIELEAYSHPYK